MRQSAFAVCDDDMSSADSLEKYIKQIYKNAEIVRYEYADQLIACLLYTSRNRITSFI